MLRFQHERLRGVGLKPNLPLIFQPDWDLYREGLGRGSPNRGPADSPLLNIYWTWVKNGMTAPDVTRLMTFHSGLLSLKLVTGSASEGGENKAGGEGSPPG